ncbi:hypothetical protein DL768_005318 [Monosporascus sp. mg162]|nr:hypothetical protein DL768_005318 [Monosporascus sp. mg162]
MKPEASERRVSRRAHTKSRRGCIVCKKRRVKCDEGRPRCRNCSVGDRQCSYSVQSTSYRQGTSSAALSSSSLGSARSLLTGPRNGGSGGSDLGALSLRGGFTALHMILLYHCSTNMSNYMSIEGDMNPIIASALDSALSAPYVLDQLLALSALHLATQEPETASLLYHQATELQTRALGLFNDAREDVSESTCIPSFLFASLLGIHILRNTLADHLHTVGEFVSAFVDYIRIHRGVRAVTNRYWKQLLESDFKPLQYVIRLMDDAQELTPGTETAQLRAYLESSTDRLTSSVEASLEATRWVQWVLDLGAQPSTPTLGVHAIMAWSLLVPDEYIENLYQHRPEALVILAYFGAALHQQRGFWVFGNAGSVLVRLVTAHVGPFWAEAMAWPQQVVAQGCFNS